MFGRQIPKTSATVARPEKNPFGEDDELGKLSWEDRVEGFELMCSDLREAVDCSIANLKEEFPEIFAQTEEARLSGVETDESVIDVVIEERVVVHRALSCRSSNASFAQRLAEIDSISAELGVDTTDLAEAS